MATRRPRLTVLATTLALVTTACTGDEQAARYPAVPDDEAGDPETTLVVYSRDRQFAEPLFDRFERATGITVEARWGDPIKLAEQVIEDGAESPADVFYAPLSDSLGSLSAAGRLAELSDRQLSRVPKEYRSPDGTWVGTSGRAHVVFYNTDNLSAEDLPDSILGFTDPTWRGRIGWDPTSRSLQDVVTELGQLNGDDAARDWLDGIQANRPVTMKGALAVVDAVAAGELADVGFGSHTYLYFQQANGDAANVAAKFYLGGAPGGLLNVAGVGIVKGTDSKAAATAFVDFMLSRAAGQSYVDEAYEIPVRERVQQAKGVPSADDLIVPGLDVRRFEELDYARRLLADAGILR